MLKGVTYIALWKFSKSQDGENFLSPKISEKFSTAKFWTLKTVETVQWILLVARSQKLSFISSKKKIPKFVLKGVTYIAGWKFSKSQDSEAWKF